MLLKARSFRKVWEPEMLFILVISPTVATNNGGVCLRLIDNPLLSLHTQFGSLFVSYRVRVACNRVVQREKSQ